jgi:predicted amidohydrolase
VKVAAVQHDIVWEDRDATMAHVAPLIADAAGAGARLVVLTELFATGFSMATDRIGEPEGGPTSAFLLEQAAQHGVWVCGSVAEVTPGGDRPHNQLVLASPDGAAHRYAKIHPFSFAGEHEHYAPGRDAITVDVEGVRVSPFICYDLRFADLFWPVAPATDCYLVIASWPSPRRAHWTSLLAARAIENQAYVVGVNRVGEGGGLTYAGDSRIIDPMGDVLAAAPEGEEACIVADVDPAVVSDTRARLPFLADRRTT